MRLDTFHHATFSVSNRMTLSDLSFTLSESKKKLPVNSSIEHLWLSLFLSLSYLCILNEMCQQLKHPTSTCVCMFIFVRNHFIVWLHFDTLKECRYYCCFCEAWKWLIYSYLVLKVFFISLDLTHLSKNGCQWSDKWAIFVSRSRKNRYFFSGCAPARLMEWNC